jgi:hypothetical protein
MRFVALIVPINNNADYILCSEEGNIEGITKDFALKLKLSLYFLNK